MKADISVKYFLKSLIPGFIILTVFYLGWKDNQENSRMFYAFIGCIISSITFPFSMKIIQKMVIRFTGKEVWQKDFFTNPVGGSLTVIFELFCFRYISSCSCHLLNIYILQNPFRKMKGHHYMSDTNKFIVLLNKLIINKRTHSSHNNCKTQNTYKGPRHDGKRPCGNR